METTDRVAVLTPSMGRPHEFARMEASFYATSSNADLFVYLTDDDPKRGQYLFDSRTRVFIGPAGTFSTKVNWLLEQVPDHGYYMWGTDDIIYETPAWDTSAMQRCPKIGVLYFNDLYNPAHYCFPMVSSTFIHRLGYLCHPDLGHWYVDNVLDDIARRTSYVFCEDLILRHVYHGSLASDTSGDAQRYASWKQRGGVEEAVRRVMAGGGHCDPD